MNRAITVTQRYRWALPLGGWATDADYASRAATALAAITEDVQAMTVVIPFPAGLAFRSLAEDEVPTRLVLNGAGALAQHPHRALTAEEPVDPWSAYPLEF